MKSKSIKRILSLTLALMMALSMMAVPASATEGEVEIVSEEPIGIDFNALPTISAPLARSTSRPTNPFDLSKKDYEATLTLVSTSWLYTNFYFKPNSEGRIYVDCTIDSGIAAQTIRMGILDMDTKQISYYEYYVTSVGDRLDTYFYNLDPAKNYAVCWISVYDHFTHTSFSGSATISH